MMLVRSGTALLREPQLSPFNGPVVNQATTVYPQSRKMIMSICAAALIAVLLGVIDILTDRDYSTAEAAWFIGLIVVLAAVLILRFMRMATVADANGLVVRSFFRSRRVPWSRIQAIMVEANAGHFTEERQPKEIAVAYRDNGRRMPLFGVDDKNLAATNRQLTVEVELLRQRWLASRGESWQPIAAVQTKAAEMARYKVSSAVVGLLGFMSAIFVMVIITTVLVVAQVEFDSPLFLDGDSDPSPLLLGLMLGVPTIVGILAWVGSALARRRIRLADEERPVPDPGISP
jgi:Bacterial PH domain